VKTIRTIKVKIGESQEFDKLCDKFLASCNHISPLVFETKNTSSASLQKKYYAKVRSKFELPSQLTCSVFHNLSAAYQSQKSQKQWHEVKFRRKVMPVVWGRDFSYARTKGICFWGKPVKITDKRVPPMDKWCDSKLKKCDKIWYLILTYSIELPEPKTTGCVVGVDSGIKRIFTATNSNNSKTLTLSGGALNHRRRCIRQVRSKIQSVGSRSSHRLLQRMSGNEASITEHMLHCASKQLVGWAVEQGAQRIVMENLANIREASIDKGRVLRNKVHRWPYAMGQFFVQYKAAAKGIAFELVSPKNTSRGCPCCGNVDSRNRNGFKFRCLVCGHRGDADRIASINIRNRSVVTRHNLVATGSNNTPESTEPLDANSGLPGSNGSASLVLV
jgi:IS605 OrfB family transposase